VNTKVLMATQVPLLAIYLLQTDRQKERNVDCTRDRSGTEVPQLCCDFTNACKEVATPVYVVLSIYRLLGHARGTQVAQEQCFRGVVALVMLEVEQRLHGAKHVILG
jgi:hypothetical protein